MPPGTRAELVGGVVRMPSPLRSDSDHGATSRLVSFWLGSYQRATPGVDGADNATVQLGPRGEPQPDALLRIPEALGDRSRLEGGFIAGPPELVVEVSRSSRAFDLGDKRADYEAAGVAEYLVVALEPDEVAWHALRDGRYRRLGPDADGLHRSRAFPGLWLDARALFAGDFAGLAAAPERGLATPEHAAFAARMAGG